MHRFCHAFYRYDQHFLQDQFRCFYKAGNLVSAYLDAEEFPGGDEGYSILEIHGKYIIYYHIVHCRESDFYSYGGLFPG